MYSFFRNIENYKMKTFQDYPDFKPNISPREMFEIGIMGGSYFRKIKSPKTKKTYKNHHKKFKFLKDIPKNKIAQQEYDKSQINRWKKSAGPKGRFRNQLQRKINEMGSNKETIYPRLRQTLLHWGWDSRKMSVK